MDRETLADEVRRLNSPAPPQRFICFVIMPFSSELHYFYLYLKHHIESTHNIQCERADADVRTEPVLDKINDMIAEADVLIADCSGRNPNVFYELGIAHAKGKKVILISKDPLSEAPSDIRHYEFIPYSLGTHVEFLERVDNALRGVFSERYERLYAEARRVFAAFTRATGSLVAEAPRREFVARVMEAERTQFLPPLDSSQEVAEFVLPRVVGDIRDLRVMKAITDWFATATE